MKARFMIASVVVTYLLVIATVNLVYAQWPAIGTGYAVTSNFHKLDVPPGSTAVVTAGTTDFTITQVTFRWHAPDGTTPFQDTVPVIGPITTPAAPPDVPQEVIDWANDNPGIQYLYAQSSHVVTIVGDWGVQAFFQDSTGTTKANITDVIQIRATSFNVVPEVPFGTIVIMLSMFGALGVYALKKKQITASCVPD